MSTRGATSRARSTRRRPRTAPRLGKASDSRAAGFLERHGELVQVELEALDPNDLHALLEQHIAPLLDRDLIAEQRQRQRAEAAELRALADRF